MTHPEENLVVRYVSEAATEEERLEMDSHMAECRECVERVRALLFVRHSFDELWGSWTAAEHGRVYRQWQVAAALKGVVEAAPALSARALAWVRRFGDEAEIAVHTLIDRARKLSTAASGVLPAGCSFSVQPALAGVGSPESIARASGHLQRGSLCLSAADSEAALTELEAASRIDARLPQSTVSEIARDGRREIVVIADSRRGRVSVKMWPRPGRPCPSLALLIPEDDPGAAAAATFETVEGAEYLLAEFHEVSGTCELIVGPSQAP